MNICKLKKIILLFSTALLISCNAGTGEGLDQNGKPLSGNNSIPLAANFNSVQANIFTPSCATSGCHSGSAPAEGLLLTEGNSFSNLVNISSNEVALLNRVEPGNAADSYLIRKVEGTASVGLQMPRNRPALSTEKIQALRDWINNGALGPSLSSIQNNIFNQRCISCHTGTNPPAGLNLEEGQSFTTLVNVQRLFDQPEIRVVAGNASSSFLIDKLENNNLGGSRVDQMPLGGPYLDQDTINVIRDWIDEGALNN